MKNGLIIPCYNEASRIDVERFKSYLKQYQNYVFCFVNDGSKDNTAEVLDKLCENHDNAHHLNLHQNGGKAEAVRQGVLFLSSDVGIKTIGFIDADLSTDMDDYSKLVQILQAEDKNLVFGSRKDNSENKISRHWFRAFAGTVVKKGIDFIIGGKIHDTQCGAKVFNARTASLCFSDEFLTSWLFDVEVFLRMKKIYGENLFDHMHEQPLQRWEHVEGSKISLKDSIKVPVMLLNIALNYNIKPAAERVIPQLQESLTQLNTVETQ